MTSPDETTRRPPRPTVLITGASGLIGSAVARALAEDHDVVLLDIREPEQEDLAADFIRCDLTKEDSVGQAVAQLRDRHGDRLASVVHLAAYYDFSGEPSPLYQELTVDGTRRLLRALKDFHTEQFVFSSSLLVMEPSERGKPLTESSPTRAEWAYPQSKLRTESVIQAERGEIPTVILRLAGVYTDDCKSIPVAQQIRRIYEKDAESFFFPGNRDHGQSFVHLDDAVECLVRTIQRRGDLEPLELFLIGEPDVLSYSELQDILGEMIHGKQWPTIPVPKPVAKAGAWVKDKLSGSEDGAFIKPWMIDLADAHYPVDPTRAREKLKWQPQHALRDRLHVMVHRLKKDPLRWYRINKLPAPAELKQ